MRRILQTLLVIISMFFSQELFSINAYPYPIEITQPDGSKITILLKGDENIKWTQTEDGFSIMRNAKGIFEYATLDSNNDMVPSGIKARNLKERTEKETSFLSKISKNIFYSKSQMGMLKGISKIAIDNSQKVFPTTGTRKLVCILIGFQDVPFTKTKADFENLFNQVGYSADGATGSVYDYYKENSWGQLDLTVTVAGPYTANNNMAFYGANNAQGNDVKPQDLIAEAVTLANPDVNYADFDNDTDGTVDGVYVIYAGFGEEGGASTDAIWAHAFHIKNPLVFDGKTIYNYSCSSELRGNSGTNITRIGVICHEFGHVLGAADYYDTDKAENGSYLGTGKWDLMANGSWNNNGATPAHHNPYTKIYDYKWASATTLNTGANITLSNAEENTNSFYRINTTTENEFYLIENRQQLKFDIYLPSNGMIIYHVDENVIKENRYRINAGSHQGLYPVCANSSGNPPFSYGTINSTGLPFPGSSNVTSFTDQTTPNSKSWAGLNTLKPITNITQNTTNKTVSFSIMDGVACTTPTTQASAFTATSVTSSSMTIGWTRGDGNKVIVIAKEGSEIEYEPINGVNYSANSEFGLGDHVTNRIFAVYSGTGNSVTVSGLKPGITYYFSILEYSSTNCYMYPALKGNSSTSCSALSFFPFFEDFEGGTFSSCWSEILDANNLHWVLINGNGFGHPNYPPTAAHSGSKNLCLVYDGAGTKVTKLILPAFNLSAVTNPVLQYWHTQADAGGDQDELRVYYKTSAAGNWVLLQTFTNNILTWTLESIALPNPSSDYYIMFEGSYKWGSGVCIDDILVSSGAPTTQATSFTSSNITSNSMTIGWTRGSGSKVLVVAKEGATTNVLPENGKTYIANSVFNTGGTIGFGNLAVYNGTEGTVNITGLNAGTTYNFSVYEYSTPSNCYLTPALIGNVTTISTGINDNESNNSSLLSQNYPNPFENSTNIDFKLVNPAKVSLTVYNTLGQVIEVIEDKYLFAGDYSYTWKPANVSSGIYFYQLNVDGTKEVKRMIKK